MKLLFRSLFALLALTFSVNLYAQDVITGTVLDDRGEPVIGGGVVYVGTDIGVVTDIDGHFSIKRLRQADRAQYQAQGRQPHSRRCGRHRLRLAVQTGLYRFGQLFQGGRPCQDRKQECDRSPAGTGGRTQHHFSVRRTGIRIQHQDPRQQLPLCTHNASPCDLCYSDGCLFVRNRNYQFYRKRLVRPSFLHKP